MGASLFKNNADDLAPLSEDISIVENVDIPFSTQDFNFVSHGDNLSGVIDVPKSADAKALIIFVHGYGKTDVRGWNMYSQLRKRFNQLGISTVTWDKPGLGRSEGEFDINQPVQESAEEVLDALKWLRDEKVSGAHKIGIWGISRAGWIAPIAMSKDAGIDFWISVAGVTAEDNYFYLLLSNLPYEGGTIEEAQIIEQEWKEGYKILRSNGSYQDYAKATKTLRGNAYIRKMMNSDFSEADFRRNQRTLTEGNGPLTDTETGMQIYVDEFDSLLSKLNIDVLALFGEKDLNVDWQKTMRLYASTIGKNPNASLSMRSFPNGNHNIDIAESGSLTEMENMTSWVKADGYYTEQVEWLKQKIVEN